MYIIENVEKISNTPITSYHLKMNFDYPVNLLNFIRPEVSDTCTDEEMEWILESIDKLDERRKDILKMYFSDKVTYDTIAKKYGVTRERIRQILYKDLRIFKRNYELWTGDMKRKQIPILDQRFADIGLPTRTYSPILRYFFYKKRQEWRDVTVRDVLELTYEEILNMKGIDTRGMCKLLDKLDEYGLKLKENANHEEVG